MLFVKQEGPDNAIDRFITEKLIEIEAKRRNIDVTQQEIRNEMDKFNQDALESSAALSDIIINREEISRDFEKNIKIRIMIYKIIGDDVYVTEDELDQYFNENNDLIKGKDEEEIKRELMKMLLDEKVSQNYNTWIKDAKAAAKVNYIVDF